ncbi:MAG: hypothetical protein K0R38_5177 [Polyangiaceae bacterium]|nr:hypothetical protein [Polyangiaceae bacterium]
MCTTRRAEAEGLQVHGQLALEMRTSWEAKTRLRPMTSECSGYALSPEADEPWSRCTRSALASARFRDRQPFAEQLGDRLRRLRSREEIALDLIAAEQAKQLRLGGRLHALGDDLQIHRVR